MMIGSAKWKGRRGFGELIPQDDRMRFQGESASGVLLGERARWVAEGGSLWGWDGLT